MNEDRLLDAQEVAVILHVPVTWVYEAARAGTLPCLRLGRYVRFRRSEIESWLQRAA